MNKKTAYIAFDGKVFGWKIECLEYEAELKKTGVKTVDLDAMVRLQEEETEKWLKETIDNWNANSEETLFDLLTKTTGVIEQFINWQDSNATKKALQNCMKHNKLFLDKITL